MVLQVSFLAKCCIWSNFQNLRLNLYIYKVVFVFSFHVLFEEIQLKKFVSCEMQSFLPTMCLTHSTQCINIMEPHPSFLLPRLGNLHTVSILWLFIQPPATPSPTFTHLRHLPNLASFCAFSLIIDHTFGVKFPTLAWIQFNLSYIIYFGTKK